MAQLLLKFGAKVRGMDGNCGTLFGVVMDPAGSTVEGVVVERGLPVISRKRSIVPLSTVERTQEETVHLSAVADEVDHFPAYLESVVEEPATPRGPAGYAGSARTRGEYGAGQAPTPTVKKRIREGVQPDRLLLRDRVSIATETDKVGSLNQVWVDSHTQRAEHFVARRGLLGRNLAVIAADMVQAVREEYILLHVDKEAVDDLPMLPPA